MNSNGQFWSLDVVLAAAIFTLAIGLLLSSSELSIFYGQQEKNTHELFTAAFLGSNNAASRTDFWLQYTPPDCDPFYGPPTAQCSDSCPPPPAFCPANVIDTSTASANVRCGPNFDFWTDPVCDPSQGPCSLTRSVHRQIHGWLSDNELSNLENCMIDFKAPLRHIQLGISPEFNIDVNARLINGEYTHYYMAKSKGAPFFAISRKMIVFPFPFSPDANILRECLDGNCGEYLTDLNFRVWRT